MEIQYIVNRFSGTEYGVRRAGGSQAGDAAAAPLCLLLHRCCQGRRASREPGNVGSKSPDTRVQGVAKVIVMSRDTISRGVSAGRAKAHTQFYFGGERDARSNAFAVTLVGNQVIREEHHRE